MRNMMQQNFPYNSQFYLQLRQLLQSLYKGKKNQDFLIKNETETDQIFQQLRYLQWLHFLFYSLGNFFMKIFYGLLFRRIFETDSYLDTDLGKCHIILSNQQLPILIYFLTVEFFTIFLCVYTSRGTLMEITTVLYLL